MVMKLDKVLTITPAYNEKKKILAVIKQIQQFCDNILIIEDGSTDGTYEVLKYYSIENSLKIIRHERNRGYGAALITGFNYAIENNYEIVITIDADGQHDPSYIPKFLDEIKKGYDIVSGTRYHPESPVRTIVPDNPKRINDEIVNFLNEKLGISLTDAFCGFKAYRVNKLSELKLTITDYAFPLQVWVQAVMKGFRIKEIPVPLIYPNPRKDYEKILGSVEDTITYFKKIIANEIEKYGKMDGV